MYKKILIATDGSKFAEAAVIHGIELAKQLGSKPVIVTVTETWSAHQLAEKVKKGVSTAVQDYINSMKEMAQDILKDAKKVADAAGVDCETVHISDRFPAEGIIDAAEREGCDLIVMASHGRRGLGRMLMGSQTAEVLGFSKIPVLVLR